MKLIIGLGNPGKKYQNTRHNVGFVVVDKLASIYNIQFIISKKTESLVAKIDIEGKKIIFAKPQTFMNDSGSAVRSLIDFYKIAPSNIIIIHDDKDILLGEYKIQTNRGAAGHNGIKSIIEHLSTQNFTRVRIGIKSTGNQLNIDATDFVLGKFTKSELAVFNSVTDKLLEEIKNYLDKQ